MTASTPEKGTGGRPPKFKEVRRPITVTLPERILKSLERVNPDRAIALVKCVESTIGTGNDEKTPVELVEVLPGKALIVVNSDRSLSRVEWLRLVEMAPARYLLVLPPGMPIERLEVEMRDLMEELETADQGEHYLLEQLHKILIQHRRKKGISKAELLLVDVSR